MLSKISVLTIQVILILILVNTSGHKLMLNRMNEDSIQQGLGDEWPSLNTCGQMEEGTTSGWAQHIILVSKKIDKYYSCCRGNNLFMIFSRLPLLFLMFLCKMKDKKDINDSYISTNWLKCQVTLHTVIYLQIAFYPWLKCQVTLDTVSAYILLVHSISNFN